MFIYRITTLLCACLSALALTGCTAPDVPSPSQGLTVVTGLYPFAYLAGEIGGTSVTVTNLTPPGAEPHDLELTPRQVASLAAADLVIYLPGLQPAVDQAITELAPDRLIDVTQLVTLIDLSVGDPNAVPEDPNAVPEAPATDTPTTSTGQDPHLWLDPIRLTTIASAIATTLAERDPDHAAAYHSAAAHLNTRLETLDANYHSGLADCVRTTFITSHAAFGYLAERYDLHQVAIAGISPDAEPSPARLAAIQQLARRYEITTIFFETLASPALAETLAHDLGLATAVLDPIEGLSDDSAATDYIGLMEANLAALREANQCR